MRKREAAFTTKFQKVARSLIPAPAVFEVKKTTKSLPFSSIRPHQKHWLLASVGNNPVSYKIPDVGESYKPFDFFMLANTDSYVVISYPAGWVAIGSEIFFEEEARSDRKSLTWERATKIAAYSGGPL